MGPEKDNGRFACVAVLERNRKLGEITLQYYTGKLSLGELLDKYAAIWSTSNHGESLSPTLDIKNPVNIEAAGGDILYLRSENSVGGFITFMQRVEKRVRIVSGEMDPDYFDNKQVVEEAKRIVADNGIVEVVFFKPALDLEHARAAVEVENKAWAEMALKYAGKLGLFWTPERPQTHFGVADANHVYFEQPNHVPNGKRWIQFEYNVPDVAQLLESHFTVLIESQAQELRWNRA